MRILFKLASLSEVIPNLLSHGDVEKISRYTPWENSEEVRGFWGWITHCWVGKKSPTPGGVWRHR